MGKQKRTYVAPNGRVPFEDWLDDLRDRAGRRLIRLRIDRATLGNFGDHRTVGSGIIELRIHYGPGYRVYIGLDGDEVIVLLCGGNKNSQDADIATAHEYWEDYKRRL